jgi:hypothetical protein
MPKGGVGGTWATPEKLLFVLDISYNLIMRGDVHRYNREADMKYLIKLLQRIETTWFFFTRYMICIQWRTVKQTKFFKTYDEALEWSTGYPVDATVMIGKRGRMLAARYK